MATEAREESRAQMSKLELRRHECEERVSEEEKRRRAADVALASAEEVNRELSKKVPCFFLIQDFVSSVHDCLYFKMNEINIF